MHEAATAATVADRSAPLESASLSVCTTQYVAVKHFADRVGSRTGRGSRKGSDLERNDRKEVTLHIYGDVS
jgi:hypothetical protein